MRGVERVGRMMGCMGGWKKATMRESERLGMGVAKGRLRRLQGWV